MSNGRKTLREEIAIVQTELKNLTAAWRNHDTVSDSFRKKTVDNAIEIKLVKSSISWLTWGIRGIYGSGIITIIVWFITK